MPENPVDAALGLAKSGRADEAALLLREILRSEPANAPALEVLALLHHQGGRLGEAERLFAQAIAAGGGIARLSYNRGCILQHLAREEDALACFEAALALEPAHAGALNNRGRALIALGRYEDAIAAYGAALARHPAEVSWLTQRGTLLAGFKRYGEAAADFERAAAIDPDYPYVRGTLLQYRLYAADWRDVEAQKTAIAAAVHAGKRAVPPMAHAIFCEDGGEQRRSSALWAAHEAPPRACLYEGERYTHERIRIGYVVPELGGNPVATQIAGVFEHHDKTRFEIFLFAYGRETENPIRTRIAAACAHVVELSGKDDDAAAQLLRAQEIDIAVDVAGFVGSARPGIFARRPAPVQVNYLGFPASMGAPYMDYIVADRTLVPDGREADFAEQILFLPDTYMPTDNTRPIGAARSRAEAGLPDDGFVFCTFNNVWKFSPQIFSVWMRLLKKVEGSVFWLPRTDAEAAGNLMREAELRGVARARLIFAPFMADDAAHLARMGRADLFLDTLPFNAHSTASDALWAGLPVLTCTGNTFAGRVAASLLHALDVPELATATLDEYEATALRLARDAAALAALREKLAQNLRTAALFDTARYTRHLEAAFAGAYARHQRGEAPAHIAL